MTADVEVHWPSGTVDKLTKVAANRVIHCGGRAGRESRALAP